MANDYPRLTNNYEERQAEAESSSLNIVRLSVDNSGGEGNDGSYKFGGSYDISNDGRYPSF